MGITVKGMEDVEKMFSKLGNRNALDQLSIKAVKKGAPIAKTALVAQINAAANKGYSTGELAGSVGVQYTGTNEYGAFSVIGPSENQEQKLAWLDYGIYGTGANSKGVTSNGRTHVQKALYVREKAVSASKAAVENAVENAFLEEIDKL